MRDAGSAPAQPAVCGTGEVSQLRTRRAMASEASRTFSSASAPPFWAASTTQCDRCSSSSSRENDWSAFVAAETWVRMSMQYLSSSTIRCSPRTCPSIRRSRLRWLDFSEVYPCTCSSVVMAVPLLHSYPMGVCRHPEATPWGYQKATPTRYGVGVITTPRYAGRSTARRTGGQRPSGPSGGRRPGGAFPGGGGGGGGEGPGGGRAG